jgi:hypothetical protein
MTIHVRLPAETIGDVSVPEETKAFKIVSITQNLGPDGERRLVCWPTKPGPPLCFALAQLIAVERQ